MAIVCPSCSTSMTASVLASHIGSPVEIDVCWPCNMIWFDHLESTSLSAQSVMDFFRSIHNHRADSRNIVSLSGRCPTCRDRLAPTNDVTRTGRFSYFRCSQGHGRLISFVQFLREKNFVRNLTTIELTTLSVKVKQIRCSSCGAGIDIEHDSACRHCGSPVAVLDEQAVAKALAELDAKAESRRRAPDMTSAVPYQPSRHAYSENWAMSHTVLPTAGVADLILTGLAAIIAANLD